MPLSMVSAGENVSIQKISGKDETKKFLENLGLVVGGMVSVVSTFNGNIIVNIKNSRIALDKTMANRILVA